MPMSMLLLLLLPLLPLLLLPMPLLGQESVD